MFGKSLMSPLLPRAAVHYKPRHRASQRWPFSTLQGRAVSEVLTQRAVRHPNILPGMAYFDTGDSLYSVMPFVNGGAVSDIIAHRHPDVSPRAAAPAHHWHLIAV